MKKLLISNILIFILALFLSGCEKLIEVESPVNEIVDKEIFKSDRTAVTVLAGIYIDMGNSGIFTGGNSISVLAGLSADELISIAEPNTYLDIFYKNALTNTDNGIWIFSYNYLYRINAALEGIAASSGMTAPVKQQLTAELKFLRAFLYFYLVNLYGDLPLLTSTDIKINSTAPRTERSKIYDQIIKDLSEAENELNISYVDGDAITPSIQRLRPNEGAAAALMARVYLYMGNAGDASAWIKAEEKATSVISNSADYLLEDPDNTFLISSKEAIWQIQPSGMLDVPDGKFFVLAAGLNDNPPAGPDPFSRPVYLSNSLVQDFENGDNRKKWIDSVEIEGITYSYAYKYRGFESIDNRTEYIMVLRLAEQYLIRAEARAQQGKLVGANSAESDINEIRARAGLGVTTASSQTDLLAAILRERKLELFTEWGHRWMDLKRTGKINEVMTLVAPGKGLDVTWEPYKALYPLPVTDIQRNPSLRGHQNPGYPE